MRYLQLLAWLACIGYSSVPALWLMIHPFAGHWRARRYSPYLVLLPVWMAIAAALVLMSRPWRTIVLYRGNWPVVAGLALYAIGLAIHKLSLSRFTARQLSGVAEIRPTAGPQRLVTGGIRSRVRHPVYLAYLCEVLGVSVATGLAVCWSLTALAIATGTLMIRFEDAELEARFGEEYRSYRESVPAVIPRI